MLALGIFALDAWRTEKTPIVISKNLQQVIINQQEALKGSALTLEEEQQAINQFIDQQILVSESKKMGLDDDSTINQRLVRKFTALMSADLPNPTPEQLQQHYLSTQDNYREPGTWVVKLDSVATELEALNADEAVALEHSKHNWLIHYGLDFQRLVESAEKGVWLGPVITNQGTHYYQVVEFNPGPVKPYDRVFRYVETSWRKHQEQQRLETRVAQLKEQYQIELLP